MSLNPNYEFSLARSSDLVQIIGIENTIGSPNLNQQFNKPGIAGLILPIDSMAALLVKKRSTCLIISRNSKIIWTGAVTSIVTDAAGGTVQLGFTGWIEELDHRHVRASDVASLIFVNQTSGAIIQTLLSTVNAQTDSNGVVRPTHVTFGSSSDTQLRTRSYKAGENYGAIIRELIEIENGCDVTIDPLTRKLYVTSSTSYSDRTSVVFGFGVNPPNLSNVIQTEDGLTIFNRQNAVGANGAVISADDTTAINDAGIMLENWVSLSDLSDSGIVGAYVNAELVYTRYGTITYQLTPDSLGDVYRPYDDFILGDKVYFSAERGRLNVHRQAVRVFTLSISIENGNEIISELGVSP
jgi:hypothetical protein